MIPIRLFKKGSLKCNGVIKGIKIRINTSCATLRSSLLGLALAARSRSSVCSALDFGRRVPQFLSWPFAGCVTQECYTFVLRSPSIQYSSVCISVSRDNVLWKANLSSSPLKMDRLLASSCHVTDRVHQKQPTNRMALHCN